MPDRLHSFLAARAPDVADISILQPADPFLETAGEDLRRRIFMTESADGSLMCLRPEFTIPLCLHHLKSDLQKGRYAYGGTVFRQGRAGAVEFRQAGLEDLGNDDVTDADVACLADAVDALLECGISNPAITLGDQNLFAVVVNSLHMPAALAERFVRNFGAPEQLERLITSLSRQSDRIEETGELQQLAENRDTACLVAKITEMMQQAGLPPRAGRSAEDIAARMIDKSTELQFRLSDDNAAILRSFLQIEMPLTKAPDQLRTFAAKADLDFGSALEVFEDRIEQLSSRNINLENFTYRASFGRKLDYYTGLLFEAHTLASTEPVAGGGRYDRLCTLLGAEKPVPAVGFSIMMDRLTEGRS